MLGGYAAALLLGGFVARNRYHRIAGIVLISLTGGKLALWDVWHLPRVYQILVLVGIGTLMLGAGFLYARFGKRLLAILDDRPPSHPYRGAR